MLELSGLMLVQSLFYVWVLTTSPCTGVVGGLSVGKELSFQGGMSVHSPAG